MEQEKLDLINKFRTGPTIERDLIRGLSDESAYELIKCVTSIEKTIGLRK